MPKYRFSDEDWDRAKEQACGILIDVANRKDTIPYSDLAARVTPIQLDPHSNAMRAFLGDFDSRA